MGPTQHLDYESLPNSPVNFTPFQQFGSLTCHFPSIVKSQVPSPCSIGKPCATVIKEGDLSKIQQFFTISGNLLLGLSRETFKRSWNVSSGKSLLGNPIKVGGRDTMSRSTLNKQKKTFQHTLTAHTPGTPLVNGLGKILSSFAYLWGTKKDRLLFFFSFSQSHFKAP